MVETADNELMSNEFPQTALCCDQEKGGGRPPGQWEGVFSTRLLTQLLPQGALHRDLTGKEQHLTPSADVWR